MRIVKALTTIGREAAQIVLPSWCVVCERELPWRERVASCCRGCWEDLPRLRGARCRRCARPLTIESGARESSCIECHTVEHRLEWIEAWGHYRGSLERVIHAFKFERHDFLGEPLGALLLENLNDRGDLDFDAIVAVPMHAARERERGYNQAELLARVVSAETRIPLRRDLLVKAKTSERQSQLARSERAANVRGKFTASGEAKGLRLLLVDDICTTGETLNACAKELLRNRASKVCAIVVARA